MQIITITLSSDPPQLIGSLFLWIMKTHIDAFVCRWDGPAPWYLYRAASGSTQIECLSTKHVTLMCMSILGLLLYYPVST